MRALVTGHAGLLGRYFHRELTSRGYEVVGIDIDAPERPYDAMHLFTTGVHRFDLAVHCAAVSPHRLAIDAHPLQMGAANLMLDAAYFDWAARTEPGHLVYISSSAAYPTSLQSSDATDWLCEFDINLRHRVIGNPDAIYGWTKLTGEQLAARYVEAGGRATVVRPFSGYAADQSSKFPFGAFRKRAVQRADPFEVWGSGEQVRDFIHATDIVNATLAVVERGVTGPINLCTGVGTSMTQLARMFCSTAGYSPDIQTNPDAPAGVMHRVGDPTRMHEFYVPKISIDEGVHEALREGGERWR